MSKVFFAASGSEANDTAMKMVWYYNAALGRPEKRKIISRKGYHGVTMAAAGMTALAYAQDGFGLPLILSNIQPHQIIIMARLLAKPGRICQSLCH